MIINNLVNNLTYRVGVGGPMFLFFNKKMTFY